MASIVEVRNLCKQYQSDGGAAYTALDGIDISVNEGEFVAIMGPSGSGKSTLLYLMGGLDKPTSGEVILDGKPLSTQSATDLALIRRRRIGFIFQFFNLLPTLSAEENIVVPLLLDGHDPTKPEYRQYVEELMALVNLQSHRTHRPDQLSGGQQQRVALARALVQRPAILLADEPTGNLDSRTADDVLKLLRNLVDERKQTIVMVTHDAHAAAMADRVIMLRDGKVINNASVGNKRGTQEIMMQLAAITIGEPVQVDPIPTKN
jgi:putative ABC transport system ATP-binding protein